MNYLKKIILFFLIGISVNCKEIARINNNIRDDKNWLNMEIEKDEKIKILKTINNEIFYLKTQLKKHKK